MFVAGNPISFLLLKDIKGIGKKGEQKEGIVFYVPETRDEVLVQWNKEMISFQKEDGKYLAYKEGEQDPSFSLC